MAKLEIGPVEARADDPSQDNQSRPESSVNLSQLWPIPFRERTIAALPSDEPGFRVASIGPAARITTVRFTRSSRLDTHDDHEEFSHLGVENLGFPDARHVAQWAPRR